MRRDYIIGCIILTISITLAVMFGSKESQDMLVYSSSSASMGGYHSERIIVIANEKGISDKEKCAEKIVEKCRENSFKNVRFSYDLSKPNELVVTVCRNKKEADKGEGDFKFRYIQEAEERQYNIIDDPEKFRIEMLEETNE